MLKITLKALVASSLISGAALANMKEGWFVGAGAGIDSTKWDNNLNVQVAKDLRGQTATGFAAGIEVGKKFKLKDKFALTAELFFDINTAKKSNAIVESETGTLLAFLFSTDRDELTEGTFDAIIAGLQDGTFAANSTVTETGTISVKAKQQYFFGVQTKAIYMLNDKFDLYAGLGLGLININYHLFNNLMIDVAGTAFNQGTVDVVKLNKNVFGMKLMLGTDFKLTEKLKGFVELNYDASLSNATDAKLTDANGTKFQVKVQNFGARVGARYFF